MKTKTLRWITLVGAVLCLVVTVIVGINVNSQSVDYEEVEARIVSADKQKVRKMYRYEVVVEYQGKEYELRNLRTEEFARYQRYIGSYTTVYFANGKMYSNVTGVKTDGKAYYIYIAALFSTIALLVWHIILVKDSIGKNRKAKQYLSKNHTERSVNNEIKDDELMLIKNIVESKCIEHNVAYASFTFGEYKAGFGNAGCCKRNGRWYFYQNDDRYIHTTIQGPFSVNGMIYISALKLGVAEYLPEFEMTDEELELYCSETGVQTKSRAGSLASARKRPHPLLIDFFNS